MTINVKVGNYDLNIDKYAKEIKLEDLLKNTKVDKSIMERFFNQVAGEDGVIQGNELEALFKKIEEAAGEDKIFSKEECEKFCQSRTQGMMAKFVDGVHSHFYPEFLKQLYDINTQKVAEEEANPAKPDQEFYENGKLVKKVTYDKDGTKIEQQYKNGRIVRETKTDKNGAILEDKTIAKNGDVTFHTKVDDKNIKETFIIKDKDGNEIAFGDKSKDGTVNTTYTKDGKKYKVVYDYPDGSKRVTLYNEKERPTKEIYTSGGYKSTTIYQYDAEDNLTKEIETTSTGDETTKYYNNFDVTKIVEKNKNGETKISTNFKDGFAYYPQKIVVKDAKGVTYIEENKYDKDDNNTETVVKNANDEIISTTKRKFDKNSNLLEVIKYDKNNTQVSRETKKYDKNNNIIEEQYFGKDDVLKSKDNYKYNGNELIEVVKTEIDTNGVVTERTLDSNYKEKQKVLKDTHGNVVEEETFAYDSKGRRTRSIKKDGKGNTLEVTTYSDKGSITRDANGLVLNTVEYDGKIYKSTTYNYENGSIDCVEEFISAPDSWTRTEYNNEGGIIEQRQLTKNKDNKQPQRKDKPTF